MKKLIFGFIAVISTAAVVSAAEYQRGPLATILFGGTNTVTWNLNDFYANELMVVEVYDQGEIDLMLAVDCNNHPYYFRSNAGDWTVGAFASCIMYTKGTPYVMDDEVMSAKYDRPDLLVSDDLT